MGEPAKAGLEGEYAGEAGELALNDGDDGEYCGDVGLAAERFGDVGEYDCCDVM